MKPTALQLYSIRAELETDFLGTLKKVKEMGYDGVELAGRYSAGASHLKEYLEQLKLTAVSAHIPVEELMADREECLSYYQQAGCRYAVIPYLSGEFRYGTENYGKLLSLIPEISRAAKERNMILLYHNHDFEFQKTEQGNYVFDELYASFGRDILQAEPDTCWIAAAGEDPAAYLLKYKNRCPLVHLKDYTRENGVTFQALGKGVQDIPSLLQAAEEAGTQWLIVEQDEHIGSDAMKDSETSLAYLKKCMERGDKQWND